MKQKYQIATEADEHETKTKEVRVKFTMTIFEPNPGSDPELIEKYKGENLDGELIITGPSATLRILDQEFNRTIEIATMSLTDESSKTAESLIAKDGHCTFMYAEIR